MAMRVASWLTFLVVLVSISTAGVKAQATAKNIQGPKSGTLNLVLANKNGFVIAADSRGSSSLPFTCGDHSAARKAPNTQMYYCDDSQKLFRMTKNSAMVIAGFAADERGTVFDLSVASSLRQHFSPGGRTLLESGDGKVRIVNPSEPGVPEPPEGVAVDSFWCRTKLGPALTAVASVYYSPPAPPPPFEATFVGIQDGSVVWRQMGFSGSWLKTGPLDTLVPNYEIDQTPAQGLGQVNGFVWLAAGVPQVAEAILNGYYRTSEPEVIKYYSERQSQAALDSMSLAEMERLARAILSETEKFTYLVGGPDEIGVFSTSGTSRMLLPDFPASKSLPVRFSPREGVLYSKAYPAGRQFGTLGPQIFVEDWQHPLDDVVPQFFLASQFEDVPVLLDNNYFVRDAFQGATLKWTGKPFLDRLNTYDDCTVEVSVGVSLPHSEVFDQCRVIRKEQVTWEKGIIGEPLHYTVSGGSVTFPLH